MCNVYASNILHYLHTCSMAKYANKSVKNELQCEYEHELWAIEIIIINLPCFCLFLFLSSVRLEKRNALRTQATHIYRNENIVSLTKGICPLMK